MILATWIMRHTHFRDGPLTPYLMPRRFMYTHESGTCQCISITVLSLPNGTLVELCKTFGLQTEILVKKTGGKYLCGYNYGVPKWNLMPN